MSTWSFSLLLDTIHNINSNRPIPNTKPDPSDNLDNRDNENTDLEDNQSEERPNCCSIKPFIRHSMNKNSTSHNNRTTQATNEPHSSNTLQTSRFASVRPSDNLVRKSYVNQAIQRVEIVNQYNPDSDPGDSPLNPLDSSSASDNNNSNDSDILFKPSDIDSNNSKATKRCKKCVKRKWNRELLKLKIQMQSTKPIIPTVYSSEPNFQKYTKFIMKVNQYIKQLGLHYFSKKQVGILLNFIKRHVINF